jgi:hypothetical protein
VNLDAYRLSLAGTGRLKMRALALLAEGTNDARFEAAVMLHEVARAEQRAVRALGQPSDEVRLSSAVERCWCLLEGLDLPGAANAYGDVLEASKNLPPEQAVAMRSRLEPRFEKTRAQYAKAVQALSSVRRVRSGEPSWSAPPPRDEELDRVLREFPGVASLWFWRSLAARRPRDAWSFVRRAARLEPDDSRFVAGSVRLASTVLSRDELKEFVDTTTQALTTETAAADVWLFLALAHVDLASSDRGAQKASRLRMALDACIEGASRVGSTPAVEGGLHQTLRAVRLAVTAMLDGRTPDESVLYEAGLGELAAETPQKRRTDVIAVLRKKALELAA